MVERAAMIELSTLMAFAAIVAVGIAWLVPARFAFDGVAVWTLIVLALLSWASALWLVGGIAATHIALTLGEKFDRRGTAAGLLAVVLIAALVLAQLATSVIWIGAAFFTLRLLHVTGDWWTGKLALPSLRRHCRYQLFLPVLVTGPIHRIERFERQVARRRWDAQDFLSGAERMLLGFFLASVIGGLVLPRIKEHFYPVLAKGFLGDWGGSAFDWTSLYFVFSGATSVALGLSLMMGLRLEENFNQPWRATSLVDFWTRWHMSLTSWCRDYVFTPIMATTRSAFAGLCVAMVVIGLWHQLSLYYLLWGPWQALGIVMNRLIARFLPVARVPVALRHRLAPVLILGWLSLAHPVLSRLGEIMS